MREGRKSVVWGDGRGGKEGWKEVGGRWVDLEGGGFKSYFVLS